MSKDILEFYLLLLPWILGLVVGVFGIAFTIYDFIANKSKTSSLGPN